MSFDSKRISTCQMTAGIGHRNGTVNASTDGDGVVQVQAGLD